MSAPTAYARGYSFNGYQAANPASPLPGNKVDQEFDAVGNSISAAITALADIRRADGLLNNAVVTTASLASDVLATLNTAVAAAAASAVSAGTSASTAAGAAAASVTATLVGYANSAASSASSAATSASTASSAASTAAAGVSSTLAGYVSQAQAILASIQGVPGSASLNSPAFTGTPTAPTPATNDNTTKLATTAFVQTAAAAGLAAKAPIASPTFTGTPQAPTPAANDNSNKLATTAYTDNGLTNLIPNATYTRSNTGAVGIPLIARMRDLIAFSDFGGVPDGTTDNRNAFDNFMAALAGSGRYKGYLVNGGAYRIASEPNAIAGSINLEGTGLANCSFLADFNGSAADRGLFHFLGGSGTGPNNCKLSGFAINKAAGRTGGCHISLKSSSTWATSTLILEDLWLSTTGTDTNNSVIVIDGSAKTTSAVGARDLSFRNVHCFGATGFSVVLKSVVGLDWDGGGIYPAGGTGAATGGLQITGTAGVPSNNINIRMTTMGGVNLTYCSYVKIDAPEFGTISGASIANDGTVDHVSIVGFPQGTVDNNWVASGVRRPGAAWSAS